MAGEKEKWFRNPYEYLWMIFPFTLFFNYIAFFWIGIYAKRRLWIMFGFVYLAAFVLLMIGGELYYLDGQEDMTPLVSFLVGCGAISWIVCPIHALAVWKPFLERSRAINDMEGTIGPRPRSELQWGEVRRTKKAPDGAEETVRETISFPIDLNRCTVQELTCLPGINEERAEKAVSIRSEKDGFDSVEDFLYSMNVEPHFAVQIEKLVMVSEPISTYEYSSKGRKVDL